MKTRSTLTLVAVAALAWAAPAQAGLVGYWHYNEGSGSTVHDYSANDNDGTILGTKATWVDGHTADGAGGDSALNLPFYSEDSTSVQVPASASVKSLHTEDKFTIAMWARQTSGALYGNWVYFGTAGAGPWYLQTGTTGDDQLYMWSNADNQWQHGLGNGILGDGWTHIALTYDGTDVKLYVDGVEKTTVTPGTSFPSLDAIPHLGLGGACAYNTAAGGDIDDVVIFNTVEDVTSIMNGTHPDMQGPEIPDLYGVNFDVVPASLDAGDSFDVGYELENGGDSDSGSFQVDFYISTDEDIGTEDKYLGTESISNLSTGGSTGSMTKNLRLPSGFSEGDGTYYVGMIVDSQDAVSESDESNNSNQGASIDYDGVQVNNTDRTTATVFYVSQSTGNDSWNGQAPTPDGAGNGPWKTLARASSEYYIPDDQILLKCGDTWNEEFDPAGSGTPSNPIVIGSYGEGDKPVIDRLDYNQDRIGIHLDNQEGYKIVGLEFNRCMTGIYAEYADGAPTRQFIWIEDCYFHDSLEYGHYETYPNPRNIGLGICFFSWECDNRIVLEDITIKNCVFRRLASAVWTNSPDNFNYNASYVYNFADMTFEDCLFEEGYQWQMGIRGVDGGTVRNCVTHDIGRLGNFLAWNGVAGAMFFRCKNWVFEDSEWGCVSIGGGSWDGEAFDFEGNCDDMTMRRCLFHDTDGPGFLLCCYASDPHPNMGILMENCVLNGKSMQSFLPRCEIYNTTDWNESTWDNCRFYISPGEVLMYVYDHEEEQRTTFVDCTTKPLGDACTTTNLAPSAVASASSQQSGHEPDKAIDQNDSTSWTPTASEEQWIQLDFGEPTAVSEFLIDEASSSSVRRYVIQYWDKGESEWASCFNGRTIGSDFVAPIVRRTTEKVRLLVKYTQSGNPSIVEFKAYSTVDLGDLDGDGDVDLADYQIVQVNFTGPSVGAAGAGGTEATATTSTTQDEPSASSQGGEPTPEAEEITGDMPQLLATDPAPGAVVSGPTVLTLTFDRPVEVGANAVEVYGVATGSHNDFTLRRQGDGQTLCCEWPEPLPADTYEVRILADAILDADDGAQLDGEVASPANPDSLPSGDGTPAGDAQVEFRVE